jgi:hypothetical protein
MNKKLKTLLILTITTKMSPCPASDTLKGTADIQDAQIYNWESCNPEVYGENCLRYNSGGIITFSIGNWSKTQGYRTLMWFPGWNDTLPDSAKLLLYCKYQSDNEGRNIFIYPVTKITFEGTEADYGIGNYPDPDSGVTWNHAWLDIGVPCSLSWTNPGGDYTVAIADTISITGTDQYFQSINFKHILTYWDTSGQNYGVILINQDALPSETSAKVFGSSENISSQQPLLILWYHNPQNNRRRKIIEDMLDQK